MKNENDFFNQNSLEEKIDNQPSIEEVNSPQSSATNNIGVDLENNGIPVNSTNQTSKMSEEDESDFVEKGKKSKKPLIIIGIILVIIILAIAALFLYVKMNFTAQNFIDKNIQKINNWLDESFENVNPIDFESISSYDAKTSGSITLTSTSSELKSLNNLTLEYDLESSMKNEYEKIGLTLKEKNSNVLSGNFYVSKGNLYIDSPDIYNDTLKYVLEENPFTSINENLNKYEKLFNSENIKYLLEKSIEYLGTSLKEADLTTKYEGLNILYTYEINNENKDKVFNKYISLIKNDDLFTDLLNILDVDIDEVENNLEPTKVSIKVNILTNKLVSFELSSEEEHYIGTKVRDNKYQIVDQNDTSNYAEIQQSEDKCTITWYENNISTSQIIITTKDNEISIELNADTTKLDITIINENTKTNFTAKLAEEDTNIDLDFTIIRESDNKYSYNGKINADISGINIGANITSNQEYGNNLVTPETFPNAKDINSLSDADINLIYNNLQNKLTSLEVMQLISSMFLGDDIENYSTF